MKIRKEEIFAVQLSYYKLIHQQKDLSNQIHKLINDSFKLSRQIDPKTIESLHLFIDKLQSIHLDPSCINLDGVCDEDARLIIEFKDELWNLIRKLLQNYLKDHFTQFTEQSWKNIFDYVIRLINERNEANIFH